MAGWLWLRLRIGLWALFSRKEFRAGKVDGGLRHVGKGKRVENLRVRKKAVVLDGGRIGVGGGGRREQ